MVVGGGPGGYRAAQLGLPTALVEKERPGGVCLNWGCIPTKAMLRSAEVLETVQHSADYGVLADNIRLDWSAVVRRKERVVKTLTDGVAGLLRANGVMVVNGHARFVGPTEVEVVAVGEASLGAGGPLTQVAREASELIGRARTGTLAGDDMGGGTFTVSNLGMIGIEQFTAVINPPEAAILAVGRPCPSRWPPRTG